MKDIDFIIFKDFYIIFLNFSEFILDLFEFLNNIIKISFLFRAVTWHLMWPSDTVSPHDNVFTRHVAKSVCPI